MFYFIRVTLQRGEGKGKKKNPEFLVSAEFGDRPE